MPYILYSHETHRAKYLSRCHVTLLGYAKTKSEVRMKSCDVAGAAGISRTWEFSETKVRKTFIPLSINILQKELIQTYN